MSTYSTHRPARSVLDAVRLFCLECMGSSVDFGAEYAAVRECSCERTCSLWQYRLGTDPKHKPNVSAASLKALAASREKRAKARTAAEVDTLHGEPLCVEGR